MADSIFAELVEIQSKVRDYFGWDYQDDFLSATSISQAFSSSAPFKIVNWSVKNRQANLDALKEKLLAAHRAGIKKVLIPAENQKDLAEVPKTILKTMEIIPVKNVDEVLKVALTKPLKRVEWVEVDQISSKNKSKKEIRTN